MESRLIFRIVSGSKKGQVREFPLAALHALTIGRDRACEISLDAEQDDLVSRNHAKITIEGEGADAWIADLGSRNGTFVNRQRVSGRTRLNAGDRIQTRPRRAGTGI